MLQTQRLDDVDKAENCKLEYETVIYIPNSFYGFMFE